MERNFRKTLIIENVLTNDFCQNTNIIKKKTFVIRKRLFLIRWFFIIKKESSEFHEFDFFNEKEKK